eukprot:2582442-Pleurochrysis_carterae.AAC.5
MRWQRAISSRDKSSRLSKRAIEKFAQMPGASSSAQLPGNAAARGCPEWRRRPATLSLARPK